MDAYLTTMYFVDPQIICNGGRTQDMFDTQGTGDRLLIQVQNDWKPYDFEYESDIGRLARKPLTTS